MKKKKIKLRTKIKNRPKSRRQANRNKKLDTVTSGNDQAPVENDDAGMAVMSHVILDFARPLLETCADRDAEKKAISLAIFVWNVTLLPAAARKQTLEAYLSQCRQAIPAEEYETLSDYIERLVQDKATRFADNRKKITNCTFGDFGDDRHIEVGYTME